MGIDRFAPKAVYPNFVENQQRLFREVLCQLHQLGLCARGPGRLCGDHGHRGDAVITGQRDGIRDTLLAEFLRRSKQQVRARVLFCRRVVDERLPTLRASMSSLTEIGQKACDRLVERKRRQGRSDAKNRPKPRRRCTQVSC